MQRDSVISDGLRTSGLALLLISVAAVSAHAADVAIAHPQQIGPAPKLRLAVPPGQDPTMYAYALIGTPRLTRAHLMSLRALYTTKLTLSPREREAMRVTMMELEENLSQATPPKLEFSKQILPRDFYANIDNYRTWPGYSERERLVMEFVRRFDNDHKGLNADDQFWRRMRKAFTDREIVDMTVMAGTWVELHYMNSVLGIGPSAALLRKTAATAGAPRAGTATSGAGASSEPRTVGSGTLGMLEAFEAREAAASHHSP